MHPWKEPGRAGDHRSGHLCRWRMGAAWRRCRAGRGISRLPAPWRSSPARRTARSCAPTLARSGARCKTWDSGITALAAARDGRTLYAATYSTLWRSDDSGAHWTIVSWAGDSTTAMNVLAVNPSNPDVVYAGTSDGLYQTTDGGVSWIRLDNGLPSDSMPSVAIDSHDPASVWVGSESSGLHHSTDGGGTWTQVSDGVLPDNAAVQAIALSPADSSVIYAGYHSGLYQSVDGGMTWVALGGDVFTGSSHQSRPWPSARASPVASTRRRWRHVCVH